MGMKLLFIGGGNMAQALIGGLLQRGLALAEAVHVVEPQAATRTHLAQQWGVNTHADLASAPLAVDVVVLAVKPQQLREVVRPLAGRLQQTLVISIAAGIRAADIARWLGDYRCIVRVMPNTPALVGQGMSGLFALDGVSATERARAEQLLAAVGQTVWCAQESALDAVTAISGSGPAYVFYFLAALQQAGEQLGFDAATARQLALATCQGAVHLAQHSGTAFAQLQQNVMSKGGTTERAIVTLDAHAVAPAIVAAAQAAASRAAEMAEQLGVVA